MIIKDITLSYCKLVNVVNVSFCTNRFNVLKIFLMKCNVIYYIIYIRHRVFSFAFFLLNKLA